ncbi:lipopolysaccharide biosynthesis protein [Methyloceanibacter caenitepidi]|uniref:Uncharacterized protein n=1 Tax=Methyloceanibacter caenitepidi TaxID=1384459 RepID=A0A0A8JZ27_9HYPH|nr:lipopolysaccharide biosynthesis protein [Methyloceanibacter caenitepidi]BAQ15676.1 hypothetical protein GL4_0206 [Methyloceanibacter caenitepidi]
MNSEATTDDQNPINRDEHTGTGDILGVGVHRDEGLYESLAGPPALREGKSALNSSLINTAAGMFSLIAGFGSSVIVARALGVEGTGIVAFALWFMMLATAVSDRGWPQAVLRFIGGTVGPDGRTSLLCKALIKRFAVTTGLMAIGILGYAGWLYHSGNSGAAFVWAATAALFLTYAYAAMSIGAAHGLGRFGDAAVNTLIGCIMQPAAVLFGALVLGPGGAILGHVLRHLPQALSLRSYIGPGSSRDVEITKPVRNYARNTWLSGVLHATVETRAELAVIGLYFSFVAVGYYAVGLTMYALVVQLGLFLLASLLPHFSALHDQNDVAGLVLSYQRSLRWLGIVLAPICFGGAAIAPALIPLVFGQEFTPAVPISEVLVACSFASALTLVQTHMMLAREKSAWQLGLSGVWGAISIVLMLILVPFLGPIGAAWIKAAIAVATLASFAWYCQTRLDMPFVTADILKIVAAGLMSALAARFCLYWDPGLLGMLLGIAAGAVVYTACIALLSVLPQDEQTMLLSWISKYGPGRFRSAGNE